MREHVPDDTEPMMQQLEDIPPTLSPGGATQITIQRPAYSVEDAAEVFHITTSPPLSCKEKVQKQCAASCRCSGGCLRDKLLGFFPCIEVLKTYQWKKWIVSDIVSGLSVGVIHIPQGMGFALLTSLPPVFGLYSSLFPMLMYFIFATSRHNSMGTMAVISLMIGAVVDREAEKYLADRSSSLDPTTTMTPIFNDSQIFKNGTGAIDTDLIAFKVGIATSVTLIVGLIQLLMGFLSLGVVATFMSMPFVGSFQTGAAVHIITSQIPSIFGITIGRHSGAFKVPLTYYDIFRTLGETQVASLICGLICLAVLIVLKEVINIKFKAKLPVPIPAELIIVLFATIIAHYAQLNEKYNLPIVGDIPLGIPPPEVPSFHNAHTYIGDSIIIAVVSFAISISMAKMMAKKHKYSIDMNQELVAYGMVHSVSSFFHSFGGAQAPPRTMVHDSVGGKTQLGSLVSCALVILTCYALGPLLYDLPKSALAAIIIVALLPLFRQFKELKMYWRVHNYDFWVWVITFASVCILDVTLGLFVGMGVSILIFTLQAHLAGGHVMKKMGPTEMYLECPSNKHGLLYEVPGVKIFTFNSALFFANVEKFRTQLMAEVGSPQVLSKAMNNNEMSSEINGKTEKDETDAAGEVVIEPHENNVSMKDTSIGFTVKNNDLNKETSPRPTGIIIDCSGIHYIDLMGLGCIRAISADYLEAGVTVALAGCSDSMVTKLKAADILDSDKAPQLFPSVHDAVVRLAPKAPR